MTPKHLAMLGVAFFLTACLNTGEPFGGQRNYGFAFLDTRQLETGEFVLRPNAIFYRTGQIRLPGTNAIGNICRVEEFIEPTEGDYPPQLDAGVALQLTLSGTGTVLEPSGVPRRYLVPGDAWVEFVPGDTATLEIPGVDGEFPSWTLQAKTAEAFTPEPVPTHETPDELTLEWSPPASSAGSRMVVSLRYFTELGQHEHIYCELDDDGVHQIGVDDAEGWRIADLEGKEAIFTRWRITGEASGNSVLLIMSTLQVPTPQIVVP